MIYKMTLNDSADEMTFDLLEVPIVDKDIEGAVDNVTLDGNQYTDYLWLKKQFVQKWSILCDDEYTRLRGFYTRQFENADVPSYRLYYGDDIIRNSTLSGERIELSISGVTDGTMSLTQIDGNTTQNGTPTPSAPVPIQTVTGRQTVEVRGKNMLDMPITSGSSNGITWTVQDDGSIIIDGTTTASVNIRANYVTLPAILGETYTLSATGMNGIVNFGYKNITSGNNIFVVTSGSPSATEVATSDMLSKANRLDMFIASGKTFNNQRVTLQLELGNQATTYEPYNGQDYEINLGKNLFDKNNVEILHAYSNGPGAVANERAWSIILKCNPNTTYTYSNANSTTTMLNDSNIGFYATKPVGGTSLISRVIIGHNATSTFTTPATAEYMLIYYYWGGDQHESAYEQIQIEKGNQASSYSAYFEPIELCKISTWQDRIYKENGKWWLHKEIGKVVFDGSETWTWQPSGGYNRAGLTPDGAYIYTDTARHTSSVLSSHFSASATNGYGIVFQYQEKTWFYPQATITTLADFKTWLASNPTAVYYPLATPTTTEITNEALVEELEALQDEAISVGQHNIYTDTPNALPTLTFDLTEYLSKSTTIIPETAVRLTLTDGGVINACGCRKDVQLTMRETIE